MARYWVDFYDQRVLVMDRDEVWALARLLADEAGDEGPLLAILDALAPAENEYSAYDAQEYASTL